MSPYELMDLRATTSDTYWATLKSWLTVTFACFGAANFVGGPTFLVNYILILVFYSVTTISMGIYLSQIKKELLAIESDIINSESGGQMTLDILRPETLKSRVQMMKLQYLYLVIAPLALAGYLLSLAITVGK